MLLQCVSCSEVLWSFRSFPCCQNCVETLRLAPKLCGRCGQNCADSCQRPWVETWIDSFSARYLLVGHTYKVLRKWKSRSGLFFDRFVLQGQIRFPKNIDAITFVPQSFQRMIQLSGGSSYRVARWAALRSKAPLIQTLELTREEEKQSSLRLETRVSRERNFFIKNQASFSLKMKRVLLVDDFMTTGATLQAAARLLKSEGVLHVHAFVLGWRPKKVILGKRFE